jgi:Na+/H+-dicarboxylate symporter
MKLSFHWQILIAFVLAIMLGILFPTRYTLSQLDITTTVQSKFNNQQLLILDEKADTVFHSAHGLTEFLQEQDFTFQQQQIIKEQSYLNPVIDKIAWLGDLFIRLLMMIAIPLIITSIVSGVANMGSAGNLGRIGLKTFGYYLTTSFFAIITGLVLVNSIKPGIGADLGVQKLPDLAIENQTLGDMLLKMIPVNLFEALSSGDMLAIIFFAILIGFFITQIRKEYKESLVKLFNAGFEVMMKLTMFIIKLAPLGILGIVAREIADQADLGRLLKTLGIYMLVVLSSLSIHAMITLPALLRFVGKVSPIKQVKALRTAIITAFSTASSNATLPLTINAVEENAGASNKVSSFTLPLGATINMDGTALYEIVVVMFIVQATGYDITLAQQVQAVIIALLTSIGAAGIPMASLVMIGIILTTLGIPLETIGLVLAVDRILDMFRTAVNVWSDSCGAVIIAKSEGEKLHVDK